MAKIKFSGLIDSMSGKLGGSIIVNSALTPYIKQNSFSQQHPGSLLLSKRSLINRANKYWRGLSLANKALWEAEVSNYPYINNLGDSTEYTAYTLFNKLNTRRLMMGEVVLTTPASYVATDTPSLSWYSLNEASFAFSFSGVKNGDYFFVFGAPPQDQPFVPHLSKFRYFYASSITTASGNRTIRNTYESVLGDAQVGQYISIYVMNYTRATGGFALRSDVLTGQLV